MLGRFTRPDPANSFSLFYPQSFNRYAYGLNNPVKYVDPDGEAPLIGYVLRDLAQTGGKHVAEYGLRSWRQVRAAVDRGVKYIGLVRGTPSHEIKRNLAGRRNISLVGETDAFHGDHLHLQSSFKQKAPKDTSKFVRVGTDEHSVHFIKNVSLAIGAVGLVLDPWSEAEAAGTEDTMIPRGAEDPRFTTTSSKELEANRDTVFGTDTRNDGAAGVVKVCNGSKNDCHFEIR